MFCMVPDAQSFPFAAENRSHPDRIGDETSSDRLCHALQPKAPAQRAPVSESIQVNPLSGECGICWSWCAISI